MGPRLRLALAFALGAVIALIGSRFLAELAAGPRQAVVFSESVRVFADNELVAEVGRGTIAEVRSEASVHWVTVRFSFADKTPPFVPTDRRVVPSGSLRLERVASGHE